MNSSALSSSRNVIWGNGRCQHFVNDVNDTVAGSNIRNRNVCSIDHHATVNGKRNWVTVDGVCRHTFGDIGCWHFACNNVVEQDVSQRSLSFRRVQCCQINSRIAECLVGRCKERERAVALQCCQQFGLNDSCHKRIVKTSTLCSSRNIIWCSGRREHLVNDVDNTVAGSNIGCRHVSSVNHNSGGSYREGQWVTVNGVHREAVSYICSRHFTGQNVVKQNIGQGLLSFCCVQSSQVNAGISECLVSRCKDRERPVTLQRCQQFCLNNTCNQRVVDACTLCCTWDVVWSGCWSQYFVDNMDDAVACVNIRQSHICVVYHDSGTDSESDWVSVNRVCS